MKAYALLVAIALPVAVSTKGAPRTLGVAGAKSIALEAVSALYLAPDAEKLDDLTADHAAYEDRGPGSFKRGIIEMKKASPWKAVADPEQRLSVREIIFFKKADVPALRARLDADPEQDKRDLWAPQALPAHIGGGLGCLVVAKEMRDGKEVDTEICILVVDKVGGAHKVVYFDNS